MASTSTPTRKTNLEKKGKEKRSISARIEQGYERTKAAVKSFSTSVFPLQKRKGRGGSGPTVEGGQDEVGSVDNQVHKEVGGEENAVILEDKQENWVEKRQYRPQSELDAEESREKAVMLMIMNAFSLEEIAKDYTEDDALAALNSSRILTAFPHLAEQDVADEGPARVQAMLPFLFKGKDDMDEGMQELPDDWFEKETEKIREEEDQHASMQWEAGPSDGAVFEEWYDDLETVTFTMGSNRSAGSCGAGPSSRPSSVRFSVDLNHRI